METIVHVVSGFLGAGKTTLVRSLIEGQLKGKNIAVIENEFGEIGIDGELLKRSGAKVREINSGCICCSLSGDFRIALTEIADGYSPEAIIIEPSGIAKTSDIVAVCSSAGPKFTLGSVITVVDVRKYFSQIRNFREFYRDQVMQAGIILLTRIFEAGEEKTGRVIEDISSINPGAYVARSLDEISVTSIYGSNAKLPAGNELVNPESGIGVESYSFETNAVYGESELVRILKETVHSGNYGEIVRVKGMLKGLDGFDIKADCIGNEVIVEMTDTVLSGRICFIGKGLKRDGIFRLMEVRKP